MATVGSKSVGGTAVALTATSTPLVYGVYIKADGANTNKIYVGFANTVTAGVAAAATDGYQLNAGQEIFVPRAAFSQGNENATSVWLIAGASSQAVTFLAI